MTDKKYQDAHLESFYRLPVEMRTRLVEAVRKLYDDHTSSRTEIVDLIQSDPYTWWAGSHHGWGTYIRNFMREYYTDDQLPPTSYPNVSDGHRNFDDYYIGIVEVAFEEGIYHLLNEGDKI